MTNPAVPQQSHPTRRRLLAGGLAAGAAFAARAVGAAPPAPTPSVPTPATAPPDDYRIRNGRIKQSLMGFIFKLPVDTLIDAAARMGLAAIEGIGADPKVVDRARARGLAVSIGSGGAPLSQGPVRRDFHAAYAEKIRRAVDTASAVGIPGIIVFTGNREAGISEEQGKRNCIAGFQALVPYAQEKKVVLCLEILNSRDDTGWMTGHPGYFGDDVDLCADIVRGVDSPNCKLLFDIYHAQIMNGDVIRRIRQYKDLIGHIHTAGVPGRHEIDDTQELNYPAIMRALLEVGYKGYVSHEFVPTWSDKLAALRCAVRLCDV